MVRSAGVVVVLMTARPADLLTHQGQSGCVRRRTSDFAEIADAPPWVSTTLRGYARPVVATIKYAEGDCFGVPLRDGGFATGLVARANASGILLGYFFGPLREVPPEPVALESLRREDAILVGRFGHLGLTGGTWPTLGRLPGWSRDDWPVPVFIRYEELSGRSFRVFYDDADPGSVLREEPTPAGEGEQGPKDGLMGAGFAEKVLTNLLS
jgi:hypothetical protein